MAAKCRPLNISVCGYSQVFSREGASNDHGVVERGDFRSVSLYNFVSFRDNTKIVIWQYVVYIVFHSS